jgi:hypothetical protein
MRLRSRLAKRSETRPIIAGGTASSAFSGPSIPAKPRSGRAGALTDRSSPRRNPPARGRQGSLGGEDDGRRRRRPPQAGRKAKLDAGRVDTVFAVGDQVLLRTKELLDAATSASSDRGGTAPSR